jgi:hypothetical protein
MKKRAQVIGLVTYLNPAGQRVAILSGAPVIEFRILRRRPHGVCVGFSKQR